MATTVDGLVSGMSTSTMISQLMQIEAAPQSRLKSKVTAAQTSVTAYQSVNTKLAALKTAADDLSQLHTWRAVKPVSSSPAVTATAVSGTTNATAGSITFDVVALARAQVSTARVAAGAENSTSGITITIAGVDADEDDVPDEVNIDISEDRTPNGIATAVNAAGIGVKASVVTTSTGESVLQFTSTQTGVAGGFTIGGLDFELKQAVPPQDALVQVGGADEDGGYSVTSSTNTFTGLMSGVSLTATKVESGVTIDATADTDGIADKIKAMVDAANSVLSEVGKQTAYDAASGKGSTLSGDFMVRQITQAVLSAVSQGHGTGADQVSLNKLGIQLERSGKLAFNKTDFESAYKLDPAKIQAAGIGVADTFEALAKKQTDNVTAAVTGRKSVIDSMNDQIDNWDIRLSARQVALTKQYASLETALSNLRSQSSYLSSQLG